MFIVINIGVIFAFGLVVAAVVALAMVQSGELAERQAMMDAAERKNPVLPAVR